MHCTFATNVQIHVEAHIGTDSQIQRGTISDPHSEPHCACSDSSRQACPLPRLELVKESHSTCTNSSSKSTFNMSLRFPSDKVQIMSYNSIQIRWEDCSSGNADAWSRSVHGLSSCLHRGRMCPGLNSWRNPESLHTRAFQLLSDTIRNPSPPVHCTEEYFQIQPQEFRR